MLGLVDACALLGKLKVIGNGLGDERVQRLVLEIVQPVEVNGADVTLARPLLREFRVFRFGLYRGIAAACQYACLLYTSDAADDDYTV